MKLRLTIDRFEGDSKGIAVLLADDGTSINVPWALLPKGVKAGDALAVSIERHADAPGEVAAQKKVQDQWKVTDPGGDVRLQITAHASGWPSPRRPVPPGKWRPVPARDY